VAVLCLYALAYVLLVALADDTWLAAKRKAGGVGSLAAAVVWTVALIRR
jgi:hypothetical protein